MSKEKESQVSEAEETQEDSKKREEVEKLAKEVIKDTKALNGLAKIVSVLKTTNDTKLILAITKELSRVFAHLSAKGLLKTYSKKEQQQQQEKDEEPNAKRKKTEEDKKENALNDARIWIRKQWFEALNTLISFVYAASSSELTSTVSLNCFLELLSISNVNEVELSLGALIKGILLRISSTPSPNNILQVISQFGTNHLSHNVDLYHYWLLSLL